MKLACNYSPELMTLIVQGCAPVDYIKAGAYGLFLPEMSSMHSARPLLLHGLGNHERAGMPDYALLDYNGMNRLLSRYDSPHLAIHLAITNADAAPGMADEDIRLRFACCIACFKQNLSVPLLLENTGDTPEERTVYDLIPFVEPGQIAGILEETDTSLLLDIAHAKVTSQYRKWDLLSCFMDMPLQKVREIHITGTGIDADGAPYDAHGPMEDRDFAILEWVLCHASPEIVTLEYGGPAGFGGIKADIDVLKYQLGRMKEIIG
jgi:uncharacterized protein